MALSLTLASVLWSLASALFIALLGTASLFGGKSRPRGALTFGLFSIVWGLQIGLANLAGAAGSASTATALYLLSLAALVPLAYFLIEFAHSQVPRRDGLWLWNGLRVAVAGTAIVAALLLVSRPRSLFEGVTSVQGSFYADWGTLEVPLVALPFFGSFGVALWALAVAMHQAPTPRIASRQATLVAGLGLYVAFSATNNVVVFAGAVADEPNARDLAFMLVFLALTLFAILLGMRAIAGLRQARTAAEARRERLLAWALFLPLGWGAVEGLLVLGPLPALDTVGLWRLAGVAIIAYGLGRWWLPDLPQQTSRVAASGAGVGAAAATGAAAYGAGSLVTSGAAVPEIAALVVGAVALLPSLRLARRVFKLDLAPQTRDLAEELYGRRLEAYRAALEASMARGTLHDDKEFLLSLRNRFGITQDEQRVLLHFAHGSVIVPSAGGAGAAYERLRLLGEGGGGRTWLARDRARDRLVVLKEPLERWQRDPAVRQSVLQEANLAAKVRHPNVVTIEEVTEHKGLPVIVMEYLEGGSLADILAQRNLLPVGEAVGLMIDVLSGLEAVHARGIVHRDIKPANILITGDGVAKIADFGIAVNLQSSRTVVDGATDRAGTLSYMAPEVKAGRARADRPSDVYSCAAVLHEMICGHPPGRGEPATRSEVPPGLRAVLGNALSDEPKRRYPSARLLAQALAPYRGP